MADINASNAADRVYNNLCAFLDRMHWYYQKDERARRIRFTTTGEDLDMDYRMMVDESTQAIRIDSKLPFTVPEDKRLEMAIAVCIASFGLADGNFDFNFDNGSVYFRMTDFYINREVGDDLFRFMIAFSGQVVEHYNDKLFMVSVGKMSVDEMFAQ